MNFEITKSETKINFVNNDKLQHEIEEDEEDYYFNNNIENMNEIQQANMTFNSHNQDVRKN
jgi:hypothetical protein